MNRDEQRWIEMFRDEYRRIMIKLINVNHMSKAAQVSPLPLFSNQQGSESRRFATASVEVRVGAREALSLAWWRSSVPLCMDSTLCRSLDIWDGEVEGEVPNLSTENCIYPENRMKLGAWFHIWHLCPLSDSPTGLSSERQCHFRRNEKIEVSRTIETNKWAMAARHIGLHIGLHYPVSWKLSQSMNWQILYQPTVVG